MNESTLKLIRFCAFGGDVPVIDDWESTVRDFNAQKIMYLPGIRDSLSKLDVPEEIREKWNLSLLFQMKRFADMLSAEEELTKLLEGNGVKAVILKGFASGTYYPDPMYRTLGDIDFMVRGASPEEVLEILKRNGYEHEKKQEEMGDLAYKRHYNLKKDGAEFELHSFFSYNETDSDKRFEIMLSNADVIKDEISGRGFYRYEDRVNGLVLLEHMSHHLVSGMGMRQLLDWMFYADRCLRDEETSSAFIKEAEEYGLSRLAVYATAVCEKYFGLEKLPFTEGADEKTTDGLFGQIYSDGNFGRRRRDVNHTAAFLSSGNVFKRLHQGGLANWKACRKHKLLRPFAGVYQVFHIAKIMIKDKNRVTTVSEGRKVSEDKNALNRELKIGKYRDKG